MSSDRSGPRGILRDPGLWLGQGFVVLLAIPITFYPVVFVGHGLYEFGGARGWWQPSPPSQAGEAALDLALACAMVLAILFAALGYLVYESARHRGHTSATGVALGLAACVQAVLGAVVLAFLLA